MHIAIEGMDGSGKTSTAKRVAELLGYEFIEKPLHLITDKDDHFENYMEVIGKVNQMEPRFKARFYGLGNYLVSSMARNVNVVTDRHLASNYYWNCVDDEDYFNLLVSECGLPDITFVLHVSADERKRRIAVRNPDDPDLCRSVFDDSCYERMKYFLTKHQMRYFFIDSDAKGFDEVVQEIVRIIKQHINQKIVSL